MYTVTLSHLLLNKRSFYMYRCEKFHQSGTGIRVPKQLHCMYLGSMQRQKLQENIFFRNTVIPHCTLNCIQRQFKISIITTTLTSITLLVSEFYGIGTICLVNIVTQCWEIVSTNFTVSDSVTLTFDLSHPKDKQTKLFKCST